MSPAQLILRTVVLVLALVHAGILVANLAQTWDTFNPSYKGHYIRQQLLRPLVGLAFASLLLLCETPIVSWLTASPAP
ncbi:MAG: hypothetical protein K0R17_2030 [Rariglobus sp.]|jgi:hypothetical protein|nr:hypothetical protein [Rariglobus sp.]